MLDSVPVLFQAILWPLFGAVLILIAGHLLPNWLGRLLASAASLASLSALWSLRTTSVERVEIPWTPLNLFRMSPALHPDALSLITAIALTVTMSGVVLGLRGAQPQSRPWRGLALVALAGSLVMISAGDLLALAMGSALLDLALMGMVVSASQNADRVAWRMTVPGAASTLALVLAALAVDTQVGTASLFSPGVLTKTWPALAIAGLLRLLIFPLHPRGLRTPENACTLLVAGATGVYLLFRTQAMVPVLAEQSWLLMIGAAALTAGGLLAFTAGIGPALRAGLRSVPEAAAPGSPQQVQLEEAWFGFAVHQAGYALVFTILIAGPVPWPTIGFTLALGTLAIWWDSTSARGSQPGLPPLAQRIEAWWSQAHSFVADRFAVLGHQRTSQLGHYARASLPAIALGSLAGAPLTAGAMGRWPLYASFLHDGQAWMLFVSLAADVLLAAGLWMTLSSVWQQASSQQPNWAGLLAMIALAVPLIGVAIIPTSLGVPPVEPLPVSGWGLGLVFAVPWLLGIWLARTGIRLSRAGALFGSSAGLAHRLVDLGWLYRAAAWAGQRLAGAVCWLATVGEGEGWWGWALIILALGIMLLAAR